VQTAGDRWDFHYVADEAASHREVETAIAAVLGPGVRVNAFRRRVLAPAASGKFALLKPLAR
jgi:phenylacetate-CoA ligase